MPNPFIPAECRETTRGHEGRSTGKRKKNGKATKRANNSKKVAASDSSEMGSETSDDELLGYVEERAEGEHKWSMTRRAGGDRDRKRTSDEERLALAYGEGWRSYPYRGVEALQAHQEGSRARSHRIARRQASLGKWRRIRTRAGGARRPNLCDF